LNCTTGALAHLGLARAYALQAGLSVAAVSDRRLEFLHFAMTVPREGDCTTK